ncbi:aminotransferase class IV [Catalinimonas niigatensis]|uniref:aminotransferase class IV n=1 Tax=Catalinimonas niigatensis TaxID=1397264 RepID=UPI002666BA38|nr:aminotransferase class IV [Catalinimonas niigatensis]WPP48638.1 aminotransferase class IV [Catalinimonas niigatensis]
MLESICVDDGKAQLLAYHKQRMNRSRRNLLGITEEIKLEEAIAPLLSQYSRGLYKCRVLYQEAIEKIEFVPYQRPQIRTLKKVYSEEVEYSYKYAAREALTLLFQQRAHCDDILIIKNGMVTDTYFANLLFSDGDKWYTPDRPLLKGVQRAYLMDQRLVQERQILEEDLLQFTHFKFVNALNPFDHSPSVAISNIY